MNKRKKQVPLIFVIYNLTGGTSNKEKLKNKPLTMLRPKKNKLKLQSDDKKVSNLRVHIRSLKM